MNRLGKAKAVLMLSLLAVVGKQIYAENIRAEEQIGYDRMVNQAKMQAEEEKKFKEIDVEISFYTDLECENSSLGAVDAQGNSLIWGTLAVPREVSLGTKFSIEGYNDTFVARDRGSIKHIRIKNDGTYRIDMFIPKKEGESRDKYYERVNNYGKVKRKAKMYLE